MSSVKKIVLGGYYDVVVENNSEKKATSLGVDSWTLGLYKKSEVEELIQQLTKALEFWEFDDKEGDANKQPAAARQDQA